MRPILRRNRRPAGAPGKRLVVVAAKASASLDPQRQRRKPRLPTDRRRQLLIARDAQLRPHTARVRPSEKRPIADVPAGVSQLQSRNDRELAPQIFQRLEDRRDRVINPRFSRSEIAAVDPQPEEAEDGAPRRFVRRDVSRRDDRARVRTHRIEPRQREADPRPFQECAASQRRTAFQDVHEQYSGRLIGRSSKKSAANVVSFGAERFAGHDRVDQRLNAVVLFLQRIDQ